MYFEPKHIQFLPVQNQMVETVEVQIGETTGQSGDLVPLGPGTTFLTLHFKKDHENVRHHSVRIGTDQHVFLRHTAQPCQSKRIS